MLFLVSVYVCMCFLSLLSYTRILAQHSFRVESMQLVWFTHILLRSYTFHFSWCVAEPSKFYRSYSHEMFSCTFCTIIPYSITCVFYSSMFCCLSFAPLFLTPLPVFSIVQCSVVYLLHHYSVLYYLCFL